MAKCYCYGTDSVASSAARDDVVVTAWFVEPLTLRPRQMCHHHPAVGAVGGDLVETEVSQRRWPEKRGRQLNFR